MTETCELCTRFVDSPRLRRIDAFLEAGETHDWIALQCKVKKVEVAAHAVHWKPRSHVGPTGETTETVAAETAVERLRGILPVLRSVLRQARGNHAQMEQIKQVLEEVWNSSVTGG